MYVLKYDKQADKYELLDVTASNHHKHTFLSQKDKSNSRSRDQGI